ncbi:MAG: cysteine methyltransferase [Flavobacteriaceae bacterium]|nr:cysteine methyltransferase [Flavobacteriaceae bacterium]
MASVFFNEPTTDGFSKRTPQVLQPALTQLREYFEGARTNFELTLHPEGSEFQKRVWQQLGTIPYGRTVSYQHVANQLGNPRVIRAAASANGKNPISIIIPCHRVIGSDGSLTGYAGGLPRKKWLLQHESQAPQQALF